jgi:hypothetical protein
MRLWHRIIALLLALQFAPSGLLAAMPLVWCIGADGHAGIEYKIGGRHLEGPAGGQRHLASERAPQSLADSDYCQDLQLVAPTKTCSLVGDDGLLTFDDRNAVSLIGLSLPSLTEIVRSTRWVRPDDRAPDPKGATPRTVFLLI